MGEASERGRAWDHALRALNARDRTERELREVLMRRGCPQDAIEVVLEDLIAEGLVDDRRYADRYIEDRRDLDNWGNVRIALELERRGVPADVIEAAIADDGADELGTALALLEARIAAIGGDRDRNKAWNLLVRRGYEPELAYSAVREHEKRLRGA